MTESKSKVEEVARAIGKVRVENAGYVEDEVYARAAIEAMREPMPEMVNAMWQADTDSVQGKVNHKLPSHKMRAMHMAAIDAALNEGEG